MRHRVIWLIAAVVIALVMVPSMMAQTVTLVTGAGSAVLPSGASYSGVPLSGLSFGIGVRLAGDGTARGVFSGTLAGSSQQIVIDGKAAKGTLTSAGNATFSGTCTVDLGNGTPLITGIPFTATVVQSGTGAGTLALTLGTTALPNVAPKTGSLTVQ